MDIDPERSERAALYRVMTSLVAPRPIGWISSESEDGRHNIAPYSNFNKICSETPVVMFSAVRRENGARKTTPKNVLDTGEFVVNLATASLVDEVDETSRVVNDETSKFDLAGLEKAPAETVSPPRVAAAKAHLECTLYDSLEVYNATMILGEIQHIHVEDSLLTDGKIDMTKVDSIGRVGGPYYTALDLLEKTRSY